MLSSRTKFLEFNSLAGMAAAKRVRIRAVELIEQRGWCQREYVNPSGAICALSAIYKACDELGLDGNFGFMVQQTIALAQGALTLSRWNDMNGRTEEQVIAAIKGGSA